MPKVSVIVAAYNVEQYIKKCIDSILAQTLEDIEILIIDDGSSDKTAQIVKSFSDSRLRYLYKENGGLSDARNYGMNFAKGEYIAFVDGDDWIEPEMYRLMFESALQNDSDVVECAYFKDWTNKTKNHPVEERQNCVVKFTPYNACNKLYKASLLRESGLLFYKGIWYEDYNFNLKFSYFVKKTSFVQVPLYHYIQRSGSITHSFSDKILDGFTVRQDVFDFLSSKPDYDFNDVEWYFAKSVCIGSIKKLCKYDAQNKTNWATKNYETLLYMFPDWKKSSCLKKVSLVNLYLRCINRFTFTIICWLLRHL